MAASREDLTPMHLDAIGEVMNISMGSASTAASELLNAKVWITTPRVDVVQAHELNRPEITPSVCVRIVYVKGISGSNLMILKQADVQLILAQLMNQPLEVTPDFEFDELSMSAVCEVMNQMMGSSATALSSFLGTHVDISTPQAYVMETINFTELQDFKDDDDVVSIRFDLTIEGVIKSEFLSALSIDLAKELADKVLGGGSDIIETKSEVPKVASGDSGVGKMSEKAPESMKHKKQPQQPQKQPPGGMQGYPPLGGGYPPPPQHPMGGAMPMYDPNMMMGYPPPGYSPYGYPMNIQNAQLHQFENFDAELTPDQKGNLSLLMNVPLQVSVEIGSAKRKVKDILEFAQGTIIELERQAGAPVDVVVNGNLIARGDVVVIDDNFAVRITEIIKSNFMEDLVSE